MSKYTDADYVSYETGILLKNKNFVGRYNNIWFEEQKSWLCVPLQSVLQKWLRENFDLHIDINKSFNQYCYIIFEYNEQMNVNNALEDDENKFYDTYEEALEDALQKALKYI